jgi:hypothetical protein
LREAKAVIQDVASYQETQETLALLKILALGSRQVERGEITPLSEVVSRLRSEVARTSCARLGLRNTGKSFSNPTD